MNEKEILKKRKAILAQVKKVEEGLEKIKGMKAGFEIEAALSSLEDQIKTLKTEVEKLEKEVNKQD